MRTRLPTEANRWRLAVLPAALSVSILTGSASVAFRQEGTVRASDLRAESGSHARVAALIGNRQDCRDCTPTPEPPRETDTPVPPRETNTPVPPQPSNSAVPTRPSSPSPTRPFSVTPTILTSSSSTPTTTPTAVAPGAPSQGTLAILGCEPAAADISILFTAIGLVGMNPGPPNFIAPVFATSDPHLFLFDGPLSPPGTLFDVEMDVDSPSCPSDWGSSSQTWMSGGGVDVVLVPSGTSQLLASNLGDSPPIEAGEIDQGAWVAYYEVAGAPAGYSQVFGWNTDLSNATGGELQASVLPFPTDPGSSLNTPESVVQVWDVGCVNCNFTVDLSPLYPKQLLTQGSPIQNFMAGVSFAVKQAWNTLKQGVQALVNSLPGGGGAPAAAQAQTLVLPGGGSGDALTAGQGAPLMITEYYFRVVPKTGAQIVGAATNTVRIKFFAGPPELFLIPNCTSNPNAEGCPAAAPPGPKPYIVEILAYHGVIPPSESHAGCYIATATTTVTYQTYLWSINDWVPYTVTYPKGKSFCPEEKEDPEWWEVIINLVVDGVNWISKAYESLKSAVVDTLAEFVPDPPCGKKCLATALDGTLAAMGIPPSIPNFDQLMDQGIDYLAEQAVAQIPVPSEVGSGLAGQALELAIDEWKKEAQDQFKEGMQEGIEAAKLALSKSVSYVPDGVPVVADPAGFTQPATIVLRITRDPNVPEPAGTCSMSSNPAYANLLIVSSVTQPTVTKAMQLFNDTHSGPGPGQGPDLVSGLWQQLYETESVALPTLKPSDESLTLPVLLSPALTWGTGYGFIKPASQANAWHALYQGGQATITVPTTPCAVGTSITVPADGAVELLDTSP